MIVFRELLWECLEKRGVSGVYIRAIKDMYEGAKTSVRVQQATRSTFLLTLGYIKVQL